MVYLVHGVALLLIGIMACFVLFGPLSLMVTVAVGVPSSYRSGGGRVRSLNRGLKRSLAVALPWLAAAALMAITIFATGGIHPENSAFGLIVVFRMGVSASIALGLMMVLAEPVGRLIRPLIATVPAGVRKTLVTLFRVAVALAIAAPIYSFINFRLSAPKSIRLPLQDPIWGSFSLLVGMAGLAIALSIPIRRFRSIHLQTSASAVIAPAPPVPSPLRLAWRTDLVVPEPVEEFWSQEPMAGWRFWDWEGESLRGMREEWPHSNHSARCDTCPEVPGWSHTCGIYALKGRPWLPEPYEEEPIIFGRVELSGMVIEHDWGYRATSARIVEIWVRSQSIIDVDAIRLRYPDVEVHWDSGWDEGSLVR